ncbi:MAG: RIP metalloprotease RseP [Lachnospiraceae bacterium]|nr:RIP metalloprotease RseP [Lachnospiraceae bacterium]
MSWVSIVAAIIMFGILVFIHEFGHFVIARRNGIRVIEFAIGMGPTIFSFERKSTKYAIKLLPFGGYCRMQGFEDEQTDDEKLEELDYNESFESKSVWARIAVVAAGPIFNFILAFVFAVIVIGFIGIDKAEVYKVDEKSPAAEAGLMAGDIITKFDGENINFGREIYLKEITDPINSEKPIKIKYERDGKEYSTTIKPVKTEQYLVGFSYMVSDEKAAIGSIVKDGALAETKAKVGDIIVAVNGTKIGSAAELEQYFNSNPMTAESVVISLERGEGDNKETFDVTVNPKYAGVYYNVGFVYNSYNVREKVGPLATIKYSFNEVIFQIETVFESLGMLFKGQASVNDLSGPVGIAEIIDDTYEQSKADGALYVFLNFANLVTMISANLGVMNLLPIPGLDGGRLMFLVIEAVRRKPIDKKKEGIVHIVGMLLIMALAVYVLFHDIWSLFN